MGAVFKHHKKNTSKKDRKLEKLYLTSMEFYNRHLDALQVDLYEESLLNLYKIFELLCRDYYKYTSHLNSRPKDEFTYLFTNFMKNVYNEEFDKKKHNQVFSKFEKTIVSGTLNDTRKILMVARDLNFDKQSLNNIKNICKVRNSLSHGNLEGTDISFDLLHSGDIIIRKLMAKLVLDKSYSKTYPYPNIKHF